MTNEELYPSTLSEHIPRVIIPNKIHGRWDGLSCLLNDLTCYIIYKIRKIIRKISGQRAAWESCEIKEITVRLIKHLKNCKNDSGENDQSGWMISQIFPGKMLIMLVGPECTADNSGKTDKSTCDTTKIPPDIINIPMGITIKNMSICFDEEKNPYGGIYDCKWNFKSI